MRAVIQRVASASVEVDGKTISSIGRGLLVLVGVAPGDGAADVDWLARKLLAARLFPDAAGTPWSASVTDATPAAPGEPPGLELLLVSQFTLHATLRKGTRPDLSGAAPPSDARGIYASLVDRVRAAYEPARVRDGVFGAMMRVSLVNDGPVTLMLDSHTLGPRSDG